jgi:hypothetical protein
MFMNENYSNACYRIVGISDEVITCECCGRDNLKKTIVVMDLEGNERYFGSNCASKYLKVKSKEVNERVRELEVAKKQKEKELKEEINKFINSHPVTKQVWNEQKEANEKNISFKQRQEMGLIKRWLEMDKRVKEEAKQKYNVTI